MDGVRIAHASQAAICGIREPGCGSRGQQRGRQVGNLLSPRSRRSAPQKLVVSMANSGSATELLIAPEDGLVPWIGNQLANCRRHA